MFLNVVFALVWLAFLVGMIGVPLLTHSGALVFVWLTCVVHVSGAVLLSQSGATLLSFAAAVPLVASLNNYTPHRK